jgi:EAL domain-containing protein (putative c-di-GMP-specific phosphodiesterase class I)
MRAATPDGQTVSAGIATWDPATEPRRVLETATQFLTEAKRAGRDQVHVAPRPTSRALLPRPTILWQPIVDLRSTRPLGVEALSRFPEDDPVTVFEAAASVGSGPSLEAVAITYALTNRPAGLWVAVNVSLDALGSVQVQQALAGNLNGVVLELNEHPETRAPELAALAGLLDDYRERGASIAVDDWGPGMSTLDRLVTLEPDFVKVDVSRMRALDSDREQAGQRMVTSWAESVGAVVCAQGIETEEQWRALCDLGVRLGQGHFFGRPMPPDELLALPRDTVAPALPRLTHRGLR